MLIKILEAVLIYYINTSSYVNNAFNNKININ